MGQCIHLYLLWLVAFQLVTYERFWQWSYDLLTSYPLTVMMMMLQSFTAPGIVCLVLSHFRLIAVNMTTNEMMNSNRYEHFWTTKKENGISKKVFVTPFNKGSIWRNCMDFWWTQRR